MKIRKSINLTRLGIVSYNKRFSTVVFKLERIQNSSILKFSRIAAIALLPVIPNIAQALPPITFRCIDVNSNRAFKFEIPAEGKGSLKIARGFPVKAHSKLPLTGFGSKTSFRFGNEIEGGMFRNGIFYYHRHDTGTGTKVVSGTCRII